MAKFPTIPKWITIPMKVVDQIVRLVFLAFTLYAICFSLVVTYGAWRAYEYGKAVLDQVKDLQDENPVRSAYMQALQDSSPRLKIRQKFVPLDSISPWLQKAVIASEDAGFYYHPGFDVRAIADAMDANKARGKTVFGGSTITQQTAKNLFLSSERSWERKFKELAYAVLMEKYLGKERILELYLNYAQWGQDMFGCEVACEEYYKKSCSKISMDQAINLAAVLASPGKHQPDMMNSQFMAKRRSVIYANMFGADSLRNDSTQVDSTQELNDSLEDPAATPTPDSAAPASAE